MNCLTVWKLLGHVTLHKALKGIWNIAYYWWIWEPERTGDNCSHKSIIRLYCTALHCLIYWSWASFFPRHFWEICTKKLFPMKKFERKGDSKFPPCIGFWWFVTTAKRINQCDLNPRFFDTIRVLSLPEIFYHYIFFLREK